MKKHSIKNPFKNSLVFLELAVITYFFHDVIVELIKGEDLFFFYAIFVFVFISLAMAVYGAARKADEFFKKTLKK